MWASHKQMHINSHCIQILLYSAKKDCTYFQITLGCALDEQRNIPFMVIMPLYITLSKI